MTEERKKNGQEEKEREKHSVCRIQTPPCVRSKRFRVYRQNARMLNTMRAFCRHTRKRFERTHGGVWYLHLGFPRAKPRHTQAPQTPDTTPYKTRQDKTRQDKTRHDTTRHDTTRHDTTTHDHAQCTHATPHCTHTHHNTHTPQHTHCTHTHTHECLDTCTTGIRPRSFTR